MRGPVNVFMNSLHVRVAAGCINKYPYQVRVHAQLQRLDVLRECFFDLRFVLDLIPHRPGDFDHPGKHQLSTLLIEFEFNTLCCPCIAINTISRGTHSHFRPTRSRLVSRLVAISQSKPSSGPGGQAQILSAPSIISHPYQAKATRAEDKGNKEGRAPAAKDVRVSKVERA